MKIALAGAAGYTGEVLLRLLGRHPEVELVAVTSRQLAGQRVADTVPSVRDVIGDLRFSEADPEAMAATEADVWFLALPHGTSHSYAPALLAAGRKVIDLSADYRLHDAELYAATYGHVHPSPDLLPTTPYVVPEIMQQGWTTQSLIACPGCYPTSILLPLVPLLRERVLGHESIVVNSLSGVSGAGKKAEVFYGFSERTDSITAYGSPKHRHLAEIEEQLGLAAELPVTIQFTPHLAPMRRGISTTIVVPDTGQDIDALYACWNRYYADTPFVNVLPTGTYPDTAKVVGTNRADLAAVHDPRTRAFVIFSVIDNLMKGAGGQAVQILNLASGFPETAGLL